MSHFYADIQGNRGEATRGGSKSSGMCGHIRGWGVGGKVVCNYDEEGDRDIVKLFITSGSNGYGNTRLVAQTCEEEGKGSYCSACNLCPTRFKCFSERF